MFTDSQIEFLRTKHIHICIPCYGGQITEGTFVSMMGFIIACYKMGMNFTVDTLVNESLITRGRNNLVSKFMANKVGTHLVFIDSDITFAPEDLLKLILADKDIVCGAYPKKGYPIEYALNIVPNSALDGSLVEVLNSGTGFMAIQRYVFEKMMDEYADTKYRDNIKLGPQYEPFMFALFDTAIDDHGNYLSEDYTFCELWRDVGGKVWVDLSIMLSHAGYHAFRGDLDVLAKQLNVKVTKSDGTVLGATGEPPAPEVKKDPVPVAPMSIPAKKKVAETIK